MLQMGSLLLITYYLPIWFQSVKKVGPTMSGVMILPTFLAQIPAAGISSLLSMSDGNTPFPKPTSDIQKYLSADSHAK